jgi:hypothetical protein
MSFSRQHGVSYQTFIAWVRKRRESGDALPPDTPAFAEVMMQQPSRDPSAGLRILLNGVIEWYHCSRIHNTCPSAILLKCSTGCSRIFVRTLAGMASMQFRSRSVRRVAGRVLVFYGSKDPGNYGPSWAVPVPRASRAD